MTRRIYWGIATLIILLIGVSAFMLMRNTETEPKIVYKGDTEPSETMQTLSTGQEQTPFAPDVEDGFKHVYHVNLLPGSSVPDDIPEHLKLPPEWVDGRYSGLEDPKPEHYQGTAEEVERYMNILKEIIRDYNPQRPLSEIWPQYIANEKMYRAQAEADLGYTPLSGYAFNRADWLYEQTWAFPEIMEMILLGTENPPPGEEYKAATTLRIEMGELEPEWNFTRLDDGRPFFLKGQTEYTFVYKGLTEEGLPWERTIGLSRASDARNPEKYVTIDVANTSDDELKRLGGWDYSINPLTLQPIQYERYNMKYKE